jgi:hypothetical protein
MTVCIAAICQQQSSPKIVLCSDRRLDYGYAGASDSIVKIDSTGYGWMSLFACADWNSVIALREHMRAVWRASLTPATRGEALGSAERMGQLFLVTSFAKPLTEVLLCGFVQATPMIFYIRIEKGKSTVTPIGTFGAIGAGGSIASVFMGQRDCGPYDSLGKTLYAVYEAKRASEKASGVGPDTSIGFISPVPSPHLHDCPIGVVRPKGIQYLERCYKRYGFKSIHALPEMSSDMVTLRVPEDLQSTTADPSRQQPSPESPAKSDES